MRKFLAVAVVGAILSLSTSAAFASDKEDYHGPYHYHGVEVPQQVQATFPDENQTGSGSMVAGGFDTPNGAPYEQQRYWNFGH